MKTVRCAIYTRKSSEEGLEQSFNSLDAQREACAAYILSQASEGWVQTAELYDDGGLSGGTLQRPALQRLLADVAAGRVDIIVVYKVDRLTRSLLDFSKLVEAFDKAGTSFVSVTQSFNTTTSMGRLTLNMLLSFAQFEREVTAERIRDKIAASKARGMWMGGIPPLGYKPDGRTLAVVEEHASLVRHIFARYLALGNVRRLADELAAEGRISPPRQLATGKPIGGVPFSRGQLYLILNNRTYLGEIEHKEQVYPGLHPPILERALFEQVRVMLKAHTQGARRGRSPGQTPSLLAGKVTDQAGEPLIAVHASKAAGGGAGTKVRYRYYVSRALHHGDSTSGMRVPARELEVAVAERLAALLDDPLVLVQLAWLEVPAASLRMLSERCADVAGKVRQRDRLLLGRLVAAVRILADRLEIDITATELTAVLEVPLADGAPPLLTIIAEVRLSRTGAVLRLVQQNGIAVTPLPDAAIARLVARAHRWWKLLRAKPIDVTRLAEREGVAPAHLTRVLRLAFLAPEVTQALLAGTQRAGMDVAALTAANAIAPKWTDQRRALLPPTGPSPALSVNWPSDGRRRPASDRGRFGCHNSR